MYIFGMLGATVWDYVSPSMPTDVLPAAGPMSAPTYPNMASISGVHDNWDFDMTTPMPLSVDDASTFFVHTFAPLVETLTAGTYTAASAYQRELAARNWTASFQQSEVDRVNMLAINYTFVPMLNTWYSNRQGDGYANTSTGGRPLTFALNPNIARPIQVNSTVDPGTSQIWTPLLLSNGVKQGYNGYGFSNVTSSGLTATDMANLYQLADASFPYDAEQRSAELEYIFKLSGVLTDQNKMHAELFAGAGFTIVPPGMFSYMWSDYTSRFLPMGYKSIAGEMDTQILSFLDVGVHLFECGRVAWGTKSIYLQSRPIQEIRNRFRGKTVPSWTNTSEVVDGSAWLPYQLKTFVTPPFADYPSGHSTFSRGFALVMTKWFGPVINAANLPVPYIAKPRGPGTMLAKFSPLFTSTAYGNTTMDMVAQFHIYAGSSEVVPGITPANNMTLQWNTWSDLSNSIGFSRLYGGIHALSAHLGSTQAAEAIFKILEHRWAIQAGNYSGSSTLSFSN